MVSLNYRYHFLHFVAVRSDISIKKLQKDC